MSRYALIRHGNYEQLPGVPSALQPYPLTKEGRVEAVREAKLFGAWLHNEGFKLNKNVHCSTLLRAWETADIYINTILEHFQETPEIHQSAALCERSVGSAANLTTDEIERILALDPRFDTAPSGWKSDSFYKLPFDQAESLLEAGERAANHIIEHAQSSKTITLFFGHGAAFRHAACHMNVIKLQDIKRLSMHHAHPIVFHQSGATTTKLYGDWKLRSGADAVD